MNNKNGLSPREKLFCIYYADSADTEQSAINAGYNGDQKRKGEQLLSRSDIADEIARQIKSRQSMYTAVATVGYKKLAFGSIADAISLVFLEHPNEQELKNMDLFSISEIKRPKDGAIEIKFFDRLKALEKLSQLEHETNKDAGGFMDALYISAERLSDAVEEDDGIGV